MLGYDRPASHHTGWYVKGLRLKSQVLSTSFWRGLHFSRRRRAIREFEGHWLSPWHAQRAIFSRIWAFGTLSLKSENFAGPQGHLAKDGLPAL